MSTITDEDQRSGYTENRVQCKRSTTSFNLDDFELVELVAGVRVHLVGHVRRINTQIRSYVHVRGRPVVASPKYYCPSTRVGERDNVLHDFAPRFS